MRAAITSLLFAVPAMAQILESPSTPMPASAGHDLVLGDVTGDGAEDVVGVGKSGLQWRLETLRGDGLGGWLLPVLVTPVPDSANEVAGGDVDGDGLLDVAILDGGFESILVLYAQGDGSFGDLVELPLHNPGGATSIDFGHADDDEHLDLVVGQQDQPRLTLFRGDGSGGFLPGLDLIGLPNPTLVRFGDLDGDGAPDLVVVSATFPTPHRIVVALGHGDGGFDAPFEVYSGTSGNDARLADLTLDGQDELLYTVDAGVAVREWQGTGLGPEVVHAGIDTFPFRLVVDDFDADGLPDVAAMEAGGVVSILLQQPGGALVAVRGFAGGGTPEECEAADVDDDGAVDLIVAGGTVAGVTLLRGRGDGSFVPQDGYADALRDAELADVDGDGRLDLLTAFGGTLPVRLQRGRFGGDFEAPEVLAVGAGAIGVSVGEATGDDLPDLLLVLAGGAGLAQGDGDGGFAPLSATPVTGGAVIDSSPADIDGDGLVDAVLLTFDRTLHVLGNDGVGNLVEVASFFDGFGPATFDVADLDLDGFDDIVGAPTGPVGCETLLSNGDGTFTCLHESGPIAGGPELADANGDGLPDALLASLQTLRLAPGLGDGTFADYAEYPAGGLITAFAVGDLDADDQPDIVSANSSNAEVGLLLGLPHDFLDPELSQLGGAASDPMIADVDLDGVPDVVVVLPNAAAVTVLHNALGPWKRRGHSLAGSAGFSALLGEGTLQAGDPLTLQVSGASPAAPAFLVAGVGELLAPFKGGVLVPTPTLVLGGLASDAEGTLTIASTMPAGVPSETTLVFQVWLSDAGGPHGFSASTAVAATAP